MSLKFAAFTLLCLMMAWTAPVFSQEGGYVNPLSVAQGEDIQFYISTNIPIFDLRIYRFDFFKEFVMTIHGIRGGFQITPDSAYTNGCQWRVSYTLHTSNFWKPGVYEADFPTMEGNKRIVFVVRSAQPGKDSKIIVSLPVSTWEAYNAYGGKSLYGFNSDKLIPAFRVSFNRPFTDTTLYDIDQSYYTWAQSLTMWLDWEHMPVEYMMNTDLDRIPNLLGNYKILVIIGHDEYWSGVERDAIDKFLAAGNRIIILAGNTCWWKSRLEDSSQTLVCYKNYALDPVFQYAPSEATDLWNTWPVEKPENLLTGLSWRSGGVVNYDTTLPFVRGYGGFGAWNTHHWVYEGTGLREGEVFGYPSAIVGYEVDAAMFNWIDGVPTVTGEDSTPRSFRILGVSPAEIPNEPNNLRHALMGLFFNAKGGAVFNVGTNNWTNGLFRDSNVQRITKNVFTRFASGQFPPDLVAWSPCRVVQDTVNQQAASTNSRVVIVRTGTPTAFTVTANDPLHLPLKYRWTVNGNDAGNDSTIDHVFVGPEKSTMQEVMVYVFNQHDTASLKWEICTAKLKIVSVPRDSVLPPKKNFRYAIDVADLYNDSIRYELIAGPKWLTINYHGIVSGAADSPGRYAVVVRAFDGHGNNDTQSFVLHIQDPNAVVSHGITPGVSRIVNFPNPFCTSTTITFPIAKTSSVTISVFDNEGRRIRTLHNISNMIGTNNIAWDGTDEFGAKAGSGTYQAEVRIVPTDGSAASTQIQSLQIIR